MGGLTSAAVVEFKRHSVAMCGVGPSDRARQPADEAAANRRLVSRYAGGLARRSGGR